MYPVRVILDAPDEDDAGTWLFIYRKLHDLVLMLKKFKNILRCDIILKDGMTRSCTWYKNPDNHGIEDFESTGIFQSIYRLFLRLNHLPRHRYFLQRTTGFFDLGSSGLSDDNSGLERLCQAGTTSADSWEQVNELDDVAEQDPDRLVEGINEYWRCTLWRFRVDRGKLWHVNATQTSVMFYRLRRFHDVHLDHVVATALLEKDIVLHGWCMRARDFVKRGMLAPSVGRAPNSLLKSWDEADDDIMYDLQERFEDEKPELVQKRVKYDRLREL